MTTSDVHVLRASPRPSTDDQGLPLIPGMRLRDPVLVHDRGGSRVVRARCESGGRKYAIKTGRAWRTNTWVADAPAREGHVLERLGRFVRYGTLRDGTWHIQEWHRGDLLSDALSPDSTLEEAAEAIQRAATAVADLHAAGWVHGDLQPEHIILTPRGPDVLIDLALAQSLDGQRPQPDFAYPGASVLYEPPEIAAAILAGTIPAPTTASDVWALAASCVMALTGHTAMRMPWPSDGDILRRPQREAVVAGRRRIVGMRGAVGRLLDAALDPNPAARPDAADICTALTSLAEAGEKRPYQSSAPNQDSEAGNDLSRFPGFGTGAGSS